MLQIDQTCFFLDVIQNDSDWEAAFTFYENRIDRYLKDGVFAKAIQAQVEGMIL